jgi:hypothetical protein
VPKIKSRTTAQQAGRKQRTTRSRRNLLQPTAVSLTAGALEIGRPKLGYMLRAEPLTIGAPEIGGEPPPGRGVHHLSAATTKLPLNQIRDVLLDQQPEWRAHGFPPKAQMSNHEFLKIAAPILKTFAHGWSREVDFGQSSRHLATDEIFLPWVWSLTIRPLVIGVAPTWRWNPALDWVLGGTKVGNFPPAESPPCAADAAYFG